MPSMVQDCLRPVPASCRLHPKAFRRPWDRAGLLRMPASYPSTRLPSTFHNHDELILWVEHCPPEPAGTVTISFTAVALEPGTGLGVRRILGNACRMSEWVNEGIDGRVSGWMSETVFCCQPENGYLRADFRDLERLQFEYQLCH